MNRTVALAFMAARSATLWLALGGAFVAGDGQPPDCIDSLADARSLLSAAKYAEAEDTLRKLVEAQKKVAPASAEHGASLDLLGVLYTALAKYLQADDCLRDAAAIFKQLRGQSVHYAETLTHRANALQLRAGYINAEALINEAFAVFTKNKLEKSTEYAKALVVLADLQWAQGKNSAARTNYSRAIYIFKAQDCWNVRSIWPKPRS
jgi:tetratricopeptide (TPR) repeat protein